VRGVGVGGVAGLGNCNGSLTAGVVGSVAAEEVAGGGILQKRQCVSISKDYVVQCVLHCTCISNIDVDFHM
jgi:hypothetical protein